jgi:hypothetical protein
LGIREMEVLVMAVLLRFGLTGVFTALTDRRARM